MAVPEGQQDIRLPRHGADGGQGIGQRGAMPHPPVAIALAQLGEHLPAQDRQIGRAAIVRRGGQSADLDRAGQSQSLLHAGGDDQPACFHDRVVDRDPGIGDG